MQIEYLLEFNVIWMHLFWNYGTQVALLRFCDQPFLKSSYDFNN